ncbi:MAG TPA: PEGA domain-containing protein [Vicinamibacterales bacterium]|jgi:hypothetical protein|nr:PEGA domain-containing protein [Vicinamibacterales bacterium]
MKRAALTSSTALAVMALFSASLLAQSSPRESGTPRHGGGGGERSGVAVPRGSGDSGGSSGSSVTSSGGGSSSSAPSSGGGAVAGHGRDRASTRSAPERRHGPSSSSNGSARSRVPSSGSGSEPNAIGPADREAPQYARPRGDRPAVSSAVPRSTVPGGPVYPVYPIYPGYGYGIYYPGYWGFGAFYYDPWFGGGYGYPYGGYYGGGYGGGYSGSAYYGDYGKLRLKVKPREAQVYVDGYFSGVVDQFDGVFQRLTLQAGGHRVEIRADGFQTLSFEVMIAPNETVTYSGELKPAP